MVCILIYAAMWYVWICGTVSTVTYIKCRYQQANNHSCGADTWQPAPVEDPQTIYTASFLAEAPKHTSLNKSAKW